MMGLFDRSRRKREEAEPEGADEDAGALEEDDAPVEGPATWYRATHLNYLPAGEDVLVQDPERASPIALAAFELDLLGQCTYFAPIEEHAAMAGRRTGLPADGIMRRLYELVDQGLLVSQRSIMDRARNAAEAEPGSAAKLDRVAVITNDRPASLVACLRSYRDRYGDDVELAVFDDSKDAKMREENRRVAREEGAGGRILYAGEQEKRGYVVALAARSGIDPEVVGAALTEFDGLSFHSGANRNAVLLDAAGDTVLLVDDDTTSRVMRPRDAVDGLRLSSVGDPLSLSFFRSVDDALKAATWTDVDILALHRLLLGRPPAACAFSPDGNDESRSGETRVTSIDLNAADSAMISAFARGRGRIVATAAGVAGDSGMGVPIYFLSLRNEARDRLFDNYESFRSTRGVHRGVDIATVSNGRLFMAAHVALDVCGFIPPFPPVLRNEDGVFAALLRTSAPESYVTYLPWLVEHAPPDTRPADFDRIVESISQVRANDIIRDLANLYEPAPGVNDPTTRLRALGRYMTALGEAPSEEFGAFVRHRIASIIGRRVELLTHTVAEHDGQPEVWAEDCATVIEEGLRAATEDELVVADVPGDTIDERHLRFQRVVSRFGQVVEAWPALLEAARGLRVAKPV